MRIVLGVTGGIAAYKAAELARLLIQNGHEVQAVLTAGPDPAVPAATAPAQPIPHSADHHAPHPNQRSTPMIARYVRAVIAGM